MDTNDPPDSPCEPASAIASTEHLFCRSFSRCCLKAGDQCTFPAEANGTPYHMKTHSGSTTAEMIRPFPLGSISTGPALLPTVHCQSLDEAHNEVAAKYRTRDRLSSSCATTAFQVKCDGSLLERLRRVLEVVGSEAKSTFDKPMTLQDLLAAFYYRKVQAEVALHVCRLGYCRQKWDQPYKFGLPCTEVFVEFEY